MNALALWRPGSRFTLATSIAGALATLLFTPGEGAAQDKQDRANVKPAEVGTGNEELTPKPFGRPLSIDIDGKGIRTLFMFEGRSSADQRDPARVVYYHGLDLALIPRDKPLPGFPVWVQDAVQRDDQTVIEVRFRLSSPALRRACEAKLLGDMRDFFDRERLRLKVPALKVEVQKVPAKELFIAVQDRATNITLAHDTQHIANLGDEVLMSFPFKPEALALFLRCHKEGKLQFKPYYTMRADQIVTGEKQTDITYALGLRVKQLLDSRQRTKLSHDAPNTIYPILQDHVHRITRQVTMDIRSKIVADDPMILTFLHNDTMLVASCFEPANTLSYADFRKAFPAYTEEMLAEYLKPYGVTKYSGEARESTEGKQHSKENTGSTGGGFGLRLSIGPLSLGVGGQTESAERILDTIYNATGIRLVQGETKTYYEPSEVKVYRLAEGFETKDLKQASSVTLSKGPLNSYLEESPFPETYLVATVDKSLAKTLELHDHVTRLLAEKAKLQKALDAEFAKVGAGRTALRSAVDSINSERRKVNDAHLGAQGAMFHAGRNQGMVEWIIHAQKVWGWKCPDGNEIGYRSRDRDNCSAGADAQKAIVAAGNEAIDKQFGKAASEDEGMGASLTEIAKLRQEISRIDQEILSILER